MCIRTDDIPVLTLSDFSAHNAGFIMMPIAELHHNYSFVEQVHKQAYYTILFCQEGKGSMRIDKQFMELQQDSIVCTGPNSVGSLAMQNIQRGWVILFSDAFFSMRYNENVLYNFDCLKYNNVCQQLLGNEDSEEWQFYMKLMIREHQSNSKDAPGLLRSYMNILLSILNRSNRLVKESKEVRTIKDKKILAFERLIEVHYKREKLPSFYANELFISVNYLNRICREKRGISSGAMIRKRVIIEAERLLYHTYNSISEILSELGFESTSYFSTFFKKYTGCTPEAFRKNNK